MTLTKLPKAIRDAALHLSPISETPRLDAEILAAHALNMDRMDMLGRMLQLATPPEYASLIGRRLNDEPVAYITGRQAFWDIELNVSPGVLIPRSDSETLIEAAQQHFANLPPPMTVLDLGTGSGALLFAALSLFPKATGIGVDASTGALRIAGDNADALGMTARAQLQHLSWREADWTAHLMNDMLFDLILCNPPYIADDADLSAMVAEHEPHQALFAGKDGMDDYRRIIPKTSGLLSPDGIACFEIGWDQADGVTAMAEESRLNCHLHRDLAGKPRCIAMQHSKSPQKQWIKPAKG